MSAGDVVVVTGASAGVGRATAIAFARKGASVALLAHGAEGLEGARRDVEAAGGRGLVVPVDVADAEQVDHAATAVEGAFGKIDVWVNNAMATIFAPFAKISPAEYRRATEVTYLGYVWGTMAALRRMLLAGRSKMPRRPRPIRPIYQPEVAAEAIVGSAEQRRREVCVGGPTAVTILGDKLAPGLGDRYLGRRSYESQQTEEPAGEDRRDNLFEPVPGDPGAHGHFGVDALPRSLRFWATKHRRLIAILAVAAGTIGIVRGAVRH